MKKSSPSIQARVELILPSIKLIEGWGYGNLNFDAVFKWANIMYEFHKFFGDSPKSLKILDIGGGLGPLDLYFTKFGFVTNIDLNHTKTWFSTDPNGLLIGSIGPENNPAKLTRISGDFFEVIEKMSEKFDFVYDSCSIIHFQRSIIGNKTHVNTRFEDKSMLKVATILRTVTSVNSLITMATDMAHPRSIAFKEILYQNRIVNSFRFAGFHASVSVGELDFCLDLKPIDKGVKTEGSRSIEKISSSTSLEQLLSTKWPSKSLVKSKTVVGVFVFTKPMVLEPQIPVLPIGKWRNTKSFISSLAYRVINPIQLLLRGES